jgi:hypothetical protein
VESAREFDDLDAVDGFADDFECGLFLEEAFESFADGLVVVDDKHGDTFSGFFGRGCGDVFGCGFVGGIRADGQARPSRESRVTVALSTPACLRTLKRSSRTLW